MFRADDTLCPLTADNAFGPLVDQRCRTLDFTLMFEQTILSLVPNALFILAAPVCLYRLRHAPKSFLTPNWVGAIKAFSAAIIACLHFALLPLWILSPHQISTSLASAIVALIASITLVYLSWTLHFRLVCPSSLLCLYLLLSIICDALQVRTLRFVTEDGTIANVALTALCVKALLLVLECRSKYPLLREPYHSNLGAEELAGVFNRWFLTWLNPLFITGYQKLLVDDDLPKPDIELSSAYLRDRMQESFDEHSRRDSRFALIFAIFKCMLGPFLRTLLPRLVNAVARYMQPFLISKAIDYLEPAIEAEDPNTAYGLIAAAVIIYVTMALSKALYQQGQNRLDVMIRGALVGIIHNKALIIQDGVFDDSAAVTLMSSDVASSCRLFSMVTVLWSCLFEVVIGFYLLGRRVGWACIVPAILMLATSRLMAKITVGVGPRIREYKMSQQKRIGMTGSMLGSMKSIKMMGLTDTMTSVITDARVKEIEDYKAFRWLVVGFNAAANSLTIFAPSVTLIIFAIQARIRGLNSFDTELAFSVIAVISLVTSPAEQLMAILPNFSSLEASCRRIQEYILKPSKDDQRLDIARQTHAGGIIDHEIEVRNGNNPGTTHRPAIVFDDVSVRPAAEAEPALRNITFRFDVGTLNVIAGVVGSGKTTLVRAMLGDLPPDNGTISVRSRRMAYCTQAAWLTNESIKSIICGLSSKTEIDETWYRRVVTACGLDEDLHVLPNGDDTIIGSRGVQLSGGQRQRVALSRAVYARMDIVLLDDVLSALDAKTEKSVVEQLLGRKGIFRALGTTVVLITHSTQYLSLADRIIVLDEGGKIAQQGTWPELRSSGQYIRDVILEDHEHIEQKDDSTPSTPLQKSDKANAAPASSDETAKDLTRQTGDFAVYGYYFKSVGWELIALVTGIFAAYAFFLAFPRYWLKWWTEDETGRLPLYVTVYLALSIGAILSNLSYITTFLMVIAPRSGLRLHRVVLRTVAKAPQSFFATTDTGVILNRFTQDMQIVDSELPMSMMTVFNQAFRVIAECVLLFTSETYIGSTIPLCVIFLYVLQKVYLRTSRQLRFMDLEAKAPIYSNFLETLEGLPIIRAFGCENQAVATNIERLDVSQRPHYALLSAQQWLTLILDLFIASLAVVLISLAVTLRGTSSGGQIGIALNVVLALNSVLLRMLEQFTVLETSLGAIARIKSFEATTECEDKPTEVFTPSRDWPELGVVEFQDVTASYNVDTRALQSLSLRIEAGQKVGICGRTGSGKSSMLLSILRLLDMDSGTILIDGLDISTIPRETIRTRVITIPQDSFILSDTVRGNIDPSGMISEELIVEALKKVQLWSVFEARSKSNKSQGQDSSDSTNGNRDGAPATNGTEQATSSITGTAKVTPKAATDSAEIPPNPLDEPLKSSPLSQGQQQLFNLCRAIIRKHLNSATTPTRILLLDEATSNVDSETDKLMQRVIREEFKDHTIITVAHRMDTLMDSDRIAVLAAGRVVEFDSPENLLKQEGDSRSVFKELYHGH